MDLALFSIIYVYIMYMSDLLDMSLNVIKYEIIKSTC